MNARESVLTDGMAEIIYRYACRSAMAGFLRDARRECQHRAVLKVYRHWCERARWNDWRTGWEWWKNGSVPRSVPGRVTAARLRAEAKRLAQWSEEPIRARYCGEDDAESERKAEAYRLSITLRAAALVMERPGPLACPERAK